MPRKYGSNLPHQTLLTKLYIKLKDFDVNAHKDKYKEDYRIADKKVKKLARKDKSAYVDGKAT